MTPFEAIFEPTDPRESWWATRSRSRGAFINRHQSLAGALSPLVAATHDDWEELRLYLGIAEHDLTDRPSPSTLFSINTATSATINPGDGGIIEPLRLAPRAPG